MRNHCTPNKKTRDAIEESRQGRYAGTLNMSSFDNFLASIDEAKSSPTRYKTLKAMEEAKNGENITSCDSFEEYLKAVAE